MTPQFRLTEPAVKDIEQIADYIAQQSNLDRAEQFLAKLNDKFIKITQFPSLGRQRNEILPNLRSLSLERYLILYMPIGEDIEILRVVSGYRDLSALFDN
ncbi:Toxin ParE3 [Acaryochloris thomasi RCC1774]|uniref:Toxin ParE3 n=1 Tax=Acaryochloris thomasi RCC1774 TaxID=1764569 RepID=A0A2W1JQZ2_9CYAN|nr:type II toxin-antitoxin system RelE/ParE family toxin [Acaryochloris thomasi]PZD72514.1 Toxin ParE3 [Acaryochloris thomasi RCC1774]